MCSIWVSYASSSAERERRIAAIYEAKIENWLGIYFGVVLGEVRFVQNWLGGRVMHVKSGDSKVYIIRCEQLCIMMCQIGCFRVSCIMRFSWVLPRLKCILPSM